MIRRAAIVLAALGALLVAGCGGGGNGGDKLASLVPAGARLYIESVVRPAGAQPDAIDSLSSRVAAKAGSASDPDFIAAKPYLQKLDCLMMGTSGDGDRSTARFVVGVK